MVMLFAKKSNTGLEAGCATSFFVGRYFPFACRCSAFPEFSKERDPVGPVEMWESRAAFWRDFSKRRWESALFADFHGRGISIRPLPCSFYPQISLKTLIFHAALSFLIADIKTINIFGIIVLIWLLEGLVFILGMEAIGLNISIFIMAIIALCIVNFVIIIPPSLGYIGIFQA